jgi:LmbE family N-acetylglucosaminyl deacetylase
MGMRDAIGPGLALDIKLPLQLDLGCQPLLVISPHLDDAVLGCSQLLSNHPGSLVATVFTASPSETIVLTEWDQGCGFKSSREAMDARRIEDLTATSILNARPYHLGFSDSQYAPLPPAGAITAALQGLLGSFGTLLEASLETVCMPLGLFHCDHERVFEACLPLVAANRSVRWIAYEDVLYRRRPGVLPRRLASLPGEGILATPIQYAAANPHAKQIAVATYRSQLAMLGLTPEDAKADAIDDVSSAECYWLLEAA